MVSKKGKESNQLAPMCSLSAAQQTVLTNRTVFYIITDVNGRHPIKRSELKKDVLKVGDKAFDAIMERVKEALTNAFGYRLIEIVNKGVYILANNILEAQDIGTESLMKDEVLLIMILSFLFLRNYSATQAELFEFLEDLDIPVDGSIHYYFGDVKKLVTGDFFSQLYLEYLDERVEPSLRIIKWGLRARNEVSRRHLLNCIKLIYGNPDTRYFASLEKEIGREEKRFKDQNFCPDEADNPNINNVPENESFLTAEMCNASLEDELLDGRGNWLQEEEKGSDDEEEENAAPKNREENQMEVDDEKETQ